MMPVSQKSIGINKKLSELEVINICENKIWSSFLFALTLTSVTSCKTDYYYPDISSIRYQTMFKIII